MVDIKRLDVATEKPKESSTRTPINYHKKFEDLLRNNQVEEKYIKPFIKKIENRQKLPDFQFKLEDLNDVDLFNLHKKDLTKFLDYFREVLFKRLTYEPIVAEIFERKGFIYNELHLIIDYINYEFLIHDLKRFSDNWSDYVDKPIKVQACYMTRGLDKETYFKSITYFCDDHLSEFKRHYSIRVIIQNFSVPIGCLHKKCNNKDLKTVKSEPYEIGIFSIGELDFKEKQQFKKCYIFRNIDYFIEKIRNIDLSEDVEILGILRLDYTKLKSVIEKPTYYIEVIDIKQLKIKNVDESIAKTIRDKIRVDMSYVGKLIDSIHPLTFLSDIFYPTKFLKACSFITGGSWRKVRDTLNSLEGGPKESFKSSIQRSFQEKVGKRNMFRTEVGKKGITGAGLFGTTERKPNKDTPDVRYGIMAIHSDNCICLDEIENLPDDLLEGSIRNKEAGFYSILQEGMTIFCPDKGSLILSQNFMINSNGSYNHSEEYDLFDNLGWRKKNVESLLDRIDLLHIIPKPDVFTRIMILRNETKEDNGEIEREIADILEIKDYEFPKKINSIREKIDLIHFTFFHKAKQIYRKSSISTSVKEALDKMYEQLLKASDNIFDGDDALSLRGKNVCKKTLRVLASLRLDGKVNEDDFSDFRDNCIRYIIAFRNSEFFKREQLDLVQIFRDVFKTEIIDYEIDNIDIKELLNRLKAYIRRRYFNETGIKEFKAKIKTFVGSGYDLSNYRLRKLLQNNEIWLENNNYFIKSKRGPGGLTVIEKDIQNTEDKIKIPQEIKFDKIFIAGTNEDKLRLERFVNRLREIFEANENKNLELNGIRQILTLYFEEDFVKNALDEFIQEGFLIHREGKINFPS